MAQPPNVALAALEALHWAGPAGVAIYYLTARTIAFCMLQMPKRNAGSRLRNQVSTTISALVLAVVLVQALVYLARVVQESDSRQTVDGNSTTVYLFSSALLWAVLLTGLLPFQSRVWYPHVGAWTLSFVTDGSLLLLGRDRTSKAGNDTVENMLQIARVVSLLALVASALAFTVSERCAGSQEDIEPLLTVDTMDPGNGQRQGIAYGSVSPSDSEDVDLDTDDEEDPERAKELKEQQQQRLAERGSWLAYLRDFRVLIPLVWPSDDRYVMFCSAVLITILLADRALNVLVPRQMGIVVDQLTLMSTTGKLPYKDLGLWVLFTYLGSNAGLNAVSQFMQLPLEQYAYRKIGVTAFRHIMTLSMDFHNNKNSGELIAAIDQGQHLYRLIDFILLTVGPMLLDLIIAFVYLANLFDANMALIVLFVGLSYTYLGTKVAGWTVKKRRRFNKAWRTESKTENEAIHNWQTVSNFNRADYECQRYSSTVDEFNAAERAYYYLQYYSGAAQGLVLLIGRVSAALLAAHRVSQGRAPVGSFVTLISYWSVVEGPLTLVSYSVRQLSQMLVDSERLLELLNTKATVTEEPEAPPLKITHGKVEFRNVDFSYDPRKSTLEGVSFVAESGHTIALVGETGGGKTTILKLLYRYYDVQNGSIRIDDQDIRDVSLDSLRDSFGMVPQDPALFNLSIMENVRYARLEATDDEVYEACRAAAIHDKILSFPDGYKATVGERGVKLSGGELQRVAIARAILRNPQIVLLDEATSQVDAETEGLIQEAFKNLTAGKTTFVVAHRLSTIQHADKILVISNGKIVESGTHEELFALKGRYVSLWSKQLSKQPDVTPKGQS
ncbi:putative ABC transporter [Delphinella strobiligena]|nr:putative ABC transporter [Delphinella strobiligena]